MRLFFYNTFIIQKAIDNMKKEYTILIIAHRLSTVINSDRILFLKEGKIEGEGSHKKLLRSCADYRKLYEKEMEKQMRIVTILVIAI